MTTSYKIGRAVELCKYPPNRGLMDWDRILEINQIGYIAELFEEKGRTLYLIWFAAKGKPGIGWEVWLARDHFKPVREYAHD